MRKAWLTGVLLVWMVSIAWAQKSWDPFENREEARQRHSAERYEIYQKRGHQAPLGGYPERLGDPAPLGTERPGFASPGRGKSPLFDSFSGSRSPGSWSLEED